MRRASSKTTNTVSSQPAAAPRSTAQGSVVAQLDFERSSRDELGAAKVADRHRQLETIIRQRIESRLSGRLRKLAVKVSDDSVVLEGECATYYTKQLAQHAALGVLDEEHLENAIVVKLPH
jgi:hypothetical protein